MKVFNNYSDYVHDRILNIAEHILSTKATVRQTAIEFNISKSTVHKDMIERLPYINKNKAMEIQKILDNNKAERHIRGGEATRLKYAKKK